jgi:two-component system, chemotaxis family, chemotaxis protein CheY
MGYVKSQPRALDQTVPTARREPCVTTVLVVDDSAEARQQLRFLLEDLGHAVIEASNVQQALALVRQATPDMILSDIQMPRVDGFELCRQLQQDQTLRPVPLVLIKEESSGPDMQRFAQDVGAVAVLMKPVTPQDLRAVVDVWLFFGSVPDATQKLRRLDNEDFHKRHSKELVAQFETKVARLERLSRRYKLRSKPTMPLCALGIARSCCAPSAASRWRTPCRSYSRDRSMSTNRV